MQTNPAPKPSLSVIDVISIIVGIVIGAGIFETPSLVAANAGSSTLILLAWVAGGVATMIGALCFAELATAYPHPGGNYHYLVRAFGAAPGFLYAWARLAIIQTGSIAMLGYIFGDYATQVLNLGAYSSAVYAAAAVVVLTAINITGLVQGKRTQHLLTVLTLLGMVAIIVVGIAFPAGSATAPPVAAVQGSAGMQLGLVMIFVLLTYGGWSEAAFISAEVRNTRRDMVVALVGSIVILTAVYVLVNYALLRGLGLGQMAASQAVAADLMRQNFGTLGAVFISLAVVVAALDSMNATIITGGRTNFAMGRDYRMFAWLGRWNGDRSTPVNALLFQGAVALGLVGLGAFARNGFRTMVEYTTPVFWFFLLLTAISLMVLRRKEPQVARPFRVPLYPLTPLLFAGISLYMLYSSVVYTGIGALVGVGVLAAGALLLLFVPRHEVYRKHLHEDFKHGILSTEGEAA